MAKFLDLNGLTRVVNNIKSWASGLFVTKETTINGKPLTGNITLTPADIQALEAALKGAANGVAELDANGKLLASQLPSAVDEIIEGYLSGGKFYTESSHTTEITGEASKIYVDVTEGQNKTYRWSGTAFVEISASLTLGETSSTAFRGDHGKAAYDHSLAAHARTDATAVAKSTTNGNVLINGTETQVYVHAQHSAHESGFYKVTVDAEGHITAVTAVTKADITNLGIPGQDTTYSAFEGASASAAGSVGLVPAPGQGKQMSFLRGDGTWQEVTVPEVEAITTAEIDQMFEGDAA